MEHIISISGVPLITFPDGMQLIFRLSIFHADGTFIAALCYNMQASGAQMTPDLKKLLIADQFV